MRSLTLTYTTDEEQIKQFEYEKKRHEKLNDTQCCDINHDIPILMKHNYDKNVKLQQKKDKCEIDGNDISPNKKLKDVVHKSKKLNTASLLKSKGIRKDVTKSDLNESSLIDATSILNATEGEITEILKQKHDDNIKDLLQLKKSFRHILETYLKEIKNIYTRLQKYNSRHKLDQEAQLMETNDSDMYKKQITMKNAQRKYEFKQQERIKKTIKFSNKDEYAKLPNENMADEIKNFVIDYYKHYNDSQLAELKKEVKRFLQQEVAKWKILRDQDMAEIENMKTELMELKLIQYKEQQMFDMSNIKGLKMKKMKE